MWLWVHSVISGVNYFFHCRNINYSLVARVSVYIHALPLMSMVFLRQPTSPYLLGRDPALYLAARLVIPRQF